MTTNPHTVTVIPETGLDPEDPGIPTVTFTCTAGRTDDCHIYADGEDWEEPDAVRTEHDECWAQGWFDNDDYTYAASGDWNFQGPSGVPNAARTGPVVVEFDWIGEGCTWTWEGES